MRVRIGITAEAMTDEEYLKLKKEVVELTEDYKNVTVDTSTQG